MTVDKLSMRFCFLAAVLAMLLLGACAPSEPPLSEDEIATNNRGVGLMGQYRNEEARELFAGLVADRPDWLDARMNLAIATLNRQREGDERRALEIALGVLEEDPSHERAMYIAGLMYLYLGEAGRALEYLEPLARLAPTDAHVAYFTGQAMVQLDRVEDARDWYLRAIELDPYLRSGYYGAALALRRLGEGQAARDMLADYQRFENNPRAQLAEFRYTRMGPRAEAQAVNPPQPERAPKADGPLFEPMRALAAVPAGMTDITLTTVDLDSSGTQDLFVAGGPGATLAYINEGNKQFGPLPGHPLSGLEGVNAALWGDIDNDGLVDVFLCRKGANFLFMQDAAGWREQASSAGVADEGECVGGTLFDADHDGDLDILVVNADGPNELFNNNLDGTFRRLAGRPESDISGGNRAGRQSLAADLDADRDADIIILHAEPPHDVFLNDRLWRYEVAPGFDEFRAASLLAVSAGDLDADGQLSLFTIDRDGMLSEWQPDAAGTWQETILLQRAVPEPASAAIAILDVDGNGRPDILLQHAQGFEVLQAHSVDEPVESRHHTEQPLAALAPILLDAAKGPAVAGVTMTGPGAFELALWPPGPGRHGFTALLPTGRTERGDGMRSNASGIGTGILLRSGERWSAIDTYDRHSAPGQSLQPVALGLGGNSRADFVKLFWTDGVFQTELELAAGQLHVIEEFQRQLASCPVLFAWNGERFEFVSDLLGVGGLGFLLEPGKYSEPRPWEYFKFPEGSLAARDGRYQIKIGEPMEEIAYIDTLRLHLFDLPPGWDMTLDERMHTGGGPAPTGAPVFYRESELIPVAWARDDRGNEVTELLRTRDFAAAPPGETDPRFLARLAHEHVLELEFERPINPAGSRPVLLADGWVEYPYSQTVFAAWQAGADYSPPTLEAMDGDGHWHVVYQHFGYPAGMPREMSLPLENLPPDVTRLRLRSNWEVYWDRIAVVHAEEPPQAAALHGPEFVEARMAKTGFPRRDDLAQRVPYYDYQDRSPFWDTRYPSGYYTALGPVLPLVGQQNDALAVIGPGDELHAEFTAIDGPPAGWRRVIVLEARGFAKDMDMYTEAGDTVGPLPSTPGAGERAARDALHQRFLNRYQGGQ